MSSINNHTFNNSERRKKRKAEQGRKTSAIISGEKCEQAEKKRTDDA